MTIESNPASRLHSLLTTLLQGEGNERVLDAWARILNVSDRVEVEVPRRLVLLNDLLDDTEQLIKLNTTFNHKVFLPCFPAMRAVFSPMNLNSTRGGIILPHLTSEVMARLEFCAEILQSDWSEVEITEDALQTISRELNALIETVAASSIDVRLRKALLESLEDVRISLSLYRIHGAKGLKKNLHGLLGLVITERTELKATAERSADSADVLVRIGKLLDELCAVCEKASKVCNFITRPISFLIGLVTDAGVGSETLAEPLADVVDE